MAFIKNRNYIFKSIFLYAFLLLMILIIIKPNTARQGAVEGILLCGRVIIPSLFPFTVCILFIMKSLSGDYASEVSKKEKILIVIFSSIGGYPIGAKLLNEGVKNKKISAKDASLMLNYCVNAGPAFIIGAVGNGILNSKELGYILFVSHISASFLLSLFFAKRGSAKENSYRNKISPQNPIDTFVCSVSDASLSVLSICSFVILFSVISAYCQFFSSFNTAFKYFSLFLEITTGIQKTQNIYLISFLLGFGGLCIWCQIFSIGRLVGIKLWFFALFRILHGLFSSALTVLLIKLFGISLPCFSNSVNFSGNIFYSTPALSVSLISLGLILAISLFSKKYTGNPIDDIV